MTKMKKGKMIKASLESIKNQVDNLSLDHEHERELSMIMQRLNRVEDFIDECIEKYDMD